MVKQKPRINDDENLLHRISDPYFGNPSYIFDCNLAKLIRRKFDINLGIYYKTVKSATYFQIECNNLKAFASTVKCSTNLHMHWYDFSPLSRWSSGIFTFKNEKIAIT